MFMARRLGLWALLFTLGAVLRVSAQAEETKAAPETSSAAAVEEAIGPEGGGAAPSEDSDMPQFSFSLGLSFVSGYWGRGVFVENQDVIFQPTFAMEMKVYEDPDNFIQSFSFTYETFNSLDGGPSGSTGGHSDPEVWNETDQNLGIAFSFADNFALGAYYSWIISPNNSYDTIEEVDLRLGYDDASLWEAFGVPDFGGLQPSIALAVETKNQTDGGVEEGVYFEIALAPTLTLYEEDDFYLHMTVGATLGLSIDEYYEDSTGRDHAFGYLDFGVDFAMPLNFIPSSVGAWELTFGAHVLFLGKAAEELNDPQHDVEFIGSIGLGITF